MIIYFNPLSPCGERRWSNDNGGNIKRFQSTLPMRGETRVYKAKDNTPVEFQSTLPMRGETKRQERLHTIRAYFNPLSPCGERRRGRSDYIRFERISIHSPHAGRDLMMMGILSFKIVSFQSTLPMRGETISNDRINKEIYISIHSPHAGRDLPVRVRTAAALSVFQSTLPMRGETISSIFPIFYFYRFQSTLPMRGETL